MEKIYLEKNNINEDIKKFVIEYNKRISWNKDIINMFGRKNIPKAIIDEHLSTNRISKEKYDLDKASIYEYGPEDSWAGRLELQAYNYETYHFTYFWVDPNDTEEEYKNKKIGIIKKKVDEEYNELSKQMRSLNAKFKVYDNLHKKLIDINKKANSKKTEMRIKLKTGEIVEAVKNDELCAALYINKETDEYIYNEDIDKVLSVDPK